MVMGCIDFSATCGSMLCTLCIEWQFNMIEYAPRLCHRNVSNVCVYDSYCIQTVAAVKFIIPLPCNECRVCVVCIRYEYDLIPAYWAVRALVMSDTGML